MNLIRYLSNELEIKPKIIEEKMAVIGKWSMPLHSDSHYGKTPVAGDDTTEKKKKKSSRMKNKCVREPKFSKKKN